MGCFGAKLLTRGRGAWFNRASLISKGLKGGKRHVSYGREGIPLDTGRAIGYEYVYRVWFWCAILRLCPVSTEEKTTTTMCPGLDFSKARRSA